MKKPHEFHIPVMGTGFTVDTPLKVARYGISSVISLVDDTLIEQMRRFHALRAGEPYEEIPRQAEDSRARRITAYLNLVDRLVRAQVHALQNSSFDDPKSDISVYYAMLPEGERKAAYQRMCRESDKTRKAALQDDLRRLATPGSIDVNIMTKLDREMYRSGQKVAGECSEALAALRGYASSTLESMIVFSAGMNARLYSYAAQFADFLPNAAGRLKKRIILKVSDFRSAAIQGKFLAKRGLWVSEYRIESGLNCGGHAFPTDGLLMGPIMREFRDHRDELSSDLLATCRAALVAHGQTAFEQAPETRVTVQGGIGTRAEQELMLQYYKADGTGWGTPFLLVPEATNVDPEHLARLQAAKEEDVELSDHSPLGVPFWTLKNSESEMARMARIASGQPGSACPKGHLSSNTEFTDTPICTASRAYQRLKLETLASAEMTPEQRNDAAEKILHKTCICHDLAGGATLTHGIDPGAKTAVCCGPNIAYFDKIATLRQMADHIYGRTNLLAEGRRPHMFIKELILYIDHLCETSRKLAIEPSVRGSEALEKFRENLVHGIAEYHALAEHITEGKEQFMEDLKHLADRLSAVAGVPVPV